MPSYKDKNGSWYCKFYYTDYTGTRKQKLKRGFALQREAKDYERSFLERMQGTPEMTFKTLYELYMEDITGRLRASTVSGKRHILINRVLPYFQSKPINQITPADIRQWQNDQIDAGYSQAYLKRLQETLTAVFWFAVRFYDLPVNPCVKAGSMGKRTHSMQFWTIDQYKKVLSFEQNETARLALQLLFYSGMRLGEMLALTLGDLDFDRNIIHITKSLQRKRSGDVITPPKTENSIRDVTMPPAIMDEIRAYTARIYGIKKCDHIFICTQNLIRGSIHRCAAAAGVPVIRIHDLRHSHVSLLIDLGFSAHLIAERIGDTAQMVNNTYGHLYQSRHDEVADRLNTLN